MPPNKFWKLTKEWFERAEEDFNVALLIFEEKNYPASVCFHLHQAIEKYLKGLLVYFGKDIEEEFKIHNLVKLYGYVRESYQNFPENIKKNCLLLNRYYIETRYPEETPQYPWKEVEQAIEAAKQIKKQVLEITKTE